MIDYPIGGVWGLYYPVMRIMIDMMAKSHYIRISTVDGSEIPRPTTWDAKNPANNGMNYLSGGVDGFLPSSVSTNQDFMEYHKGFKSTVHMFVSR